MPAIQRLTVAFLAAGLGALATRRAFVSEERQTDWLQCSPSRHTALSSRHPGPAWLKTAYEATGLNATVTEISPPTSWRAAPLAFIFTDSTPPAEATPTFLATARVLQLATACLALVGAAAFAYALPTMAVDGVLLLLAMVPPFYAFDLFSVATSMPSPVAVLVLALTARGAFVMPSEVRRLLGQGVCVLGGIVGALCLCGYSDDGFGALLWLLLAFAGASAVAAAVVGVCACVAIADAIVHVHARLFNPAAPPAKAPAPGSAPCVDGVPCVEGHAAVEGVSAKCAAVIAASAPAA